MATYTGSEAITVTLVASQVDTITLTGAGTELRISQTSTTPIYIITAQPGQTPATPTVGGAGTTAIMTDYPVVLPWTGSGIVIKVISAGTGTVNFTLTNSKFAPLGDLALKADLISPTFTGIPAAPTATAGTSTTQLATTAFVTTADQLLGTYTAFTPTFGNLTVGNGSSSARFSRVNNVVNYFGIFQLGSTSAVTGVVNITLPVTANAIYATYTGLPMGDLNMFDTSTFTWYAGEMFSISSATVARTRIFTTAGTNVINNSSANTTAPFTWATGDQFLWNIRYEAA